MDIIPFYGAIETPVLDVCPGFQSQDLFITCVLHRLRAMDSSDALLVTNLSLPPSLIFRHGVTSHRHQDVSVSRVRTVSRAVFVSDVQHDQFRPQEALRQQLRFGEVHVVVVNSLHLHRNAHLRSDMRKS